MLRPTFRSFFRVGSPPLCALVVFSACSDSSTVTPTTLDPPHLRIDSINTVGGPTWTPDTPCLAPGTDPGKTLSVNIGPTDGVGHLVSPSNPPSSWTIAPPYACPGTPPCGFLVLTVDTCTSTDPASCGTDPYVLVSAAPSISVSMAQLANPLGFHRFHVELKNQDGTPAEDEKGKTYPAEVVIELVDHCGEPPPPMMDAGSPRPDAGRDAQVVGPDTGSAKPRDSSVAPVADASAKPESGTPPPNDATTKPDATSRPDARVPDARAPDATTPVDSGAPSVPTDAASRG